MNGKHPLVAWLLGWLLPGAGHWYLGQRARGAVLCASLAGCFVAGCLLGGRGTVSTGHREYLALQFGAGLPAGAAYMAGTESPADTPVSRRDLGTLYTLVPALLNLVVAMDAAARAAGGNPGGPPLPPVEAPPASVAALLAAPTDAQEDSVAALLAAPPPSTGEGKQNGEGPP